MYPFPVVEQIVAADITPVAVNCTSVEVTNPIEESADVTNPFEEST